MVQTCLKKTDLRSKLCSYLETTENVGPGIECTTSTLYQRKIVEVVSIMECSCMWGGMHSGAPVSLLTKKWIA